ncbi:MAG: histidine kinase dimerization/phospho-acceptor domain-containing protein, partial [Chitinophagales bacterium]
MPSIITKYHLHWLIGAILLFLAALPFQQAAQSPHDLDKVQQHIEKSISEIEADFKQLLADTALLTRLYQENYTAADVKTIDEKPYEILLYGNDLLYWSKHEAVLDVETVRLSDNTHFITHGNGHFVAISQIYELSRDDLIQVIGLKRLKYNYSEENKYLQNVSNGFFDIPYAVDLTTKQSEIPTDTYAILDLNIQNQLYLFNNAEKIGDQVSHAGISLQFLSLLCLFIFLYCLAFFLNQNYPVGIGFGFLVLSFVGLRYLMLQLGYPSHLNQIDLFSLDINRELLLLPINTLGDLLLTVFVDLFLILFFYRHVHVSFRKDQTKAISITWYLGFLVIILSSVYLTLLIIRILVVDYTLFFEAKKIIYLEVNSLIGLIILSALMVGLFLLFEKIATKIDRLNLTQQERLGGGVGLLLFSFVLFYLSNQLSWNVGLAFTALLSFVLGLSIWGKISLEKLNAWQIFLSICFFAGFATLAVFNGYHEKEGNFKQAFAIKKANQQDETVEALLDLHGDAIVIKEKKILNKYLNNPLVTKKEIAQRIKRKYFKEPSFDKYNITIETASKDIYSRLRRILSNKDKTYVNYLPTRSGQVNYLAKYPIFPTVITKDFKPRYYVYAKLELKSNKDDLGVYPELVLPDELRDVEYYDNYSFGIYRKKELESHNGAFIYPYIQDNIFNHPDSIIGYKNIAYDDYSHLIYQVNENRTIVISHPSDRLWRLLSLFSVFLVTGFLLVFAVVAWSIINRIFKEKLNLRNLLYDSLRKRINTSMLFILIMSFLGIGIFTIIYFYNASANQHNERLLDKQIEILNAYEKQLNNFELDSIVNKIEKRFDTETVIKELSEVHGIDINLFDHHGKLVTSSQSIIFDKEIISERMHPTAYFNLKPKKQTHFIHDEDIGGLNYKAAYIPITRNGRLINFLNTPYFAGQAELQQEVSTFLVALINVYVLLLLAGVLIAIFVSNSITNPLRMISNTLKRVRLGQQNELLTWPDQDEIGELVKQYNLTIKELDRSAKLLAQSEREYAWQEMAQQVAHEIKNPLTPMKLRIQMLQRAMNGNHPRLPEMTERTCTTMIEQIDILSRIASEFSNFAKMPTPQNARMDLKHTADTIIDLYSNTNNVTLTRHIPDEDFWVYSDKNQLSRVLTNLVKNATQAIPDDR